MELTTLFLDIDREFGFEIPESLNLEEMSFGDLYMVVCDKGVEPQVQQQSAWDGDTIVPRGKSARIARDSGEQHE